MKTSEILIKFLISYANFFSWFNGFPPLSSPVTRSARADVIYAVANHSADNEPSEWAAINFSPLDRLTRCVTNLSSRFSRGSERQTIARVKWSLSACRLGNNGSVLRAECEIIDVTQPTADERASLIKWRKKPWTPNVEQQQIRLRTLN